MGDSDPNSDSDSPSDSEYVADEVAEARTALSDAHKLSDVGGSDEAIVNRLYYACYHAAKAVLYTRGFEPTTHQGVVSLFGKDVVLEGDAPRNAGRFLNDLRDQRMTADYEHTALKADITELFDRTEAFVAEMARVAESN